jgi:hypothetical protein
MEGREIRRQRSQKQPPLFVSAREDRREAVLDASKAQRRPREKGFENWSFLSVNMEPEWRAMS